MWLNETKIELDMITDEQRVLYKIFDLKISYFKVWNCESLVYYAEQKCLNRPLPKQFEDVEDDPHQMGGDFIIEVDADFNFKIVFEYRSQKPPDRPSISNLSDSLKKCHQ